MRQHSRSGRRACGAGKGGGPPARLTGRSMGRGFWKSGGWAARLAPARMGGGGGGGGASREFDTQRAQRCSAGYRGACARLFLRALLHSVLCCAVLCCVVRCSSAGNGKRAEEKRSLWSRGIRRPAHTLAAAPWLLLFLSRPPPQATASPSLSSTTDTKYNVVICCTCLCANSGSRHKAKLGGSCSGGSCRASHPRLSNPPLPPPLRYSTEARRSAFPRLHYLVLRAHVHHEDVRAKHIFSPPPCFPKAPGTAGRRPQRSCAASQRQQQQGLAPPHSRHMPFDWHS